MTTGAVRSFVAIPVGPASGRLAHLPDRVAAGVKGLKWVRPEQAHITLAFLGEVPGERLEALGPLLRERLGPRPPFELALRGLGAFPSPGRARVLWLGLQGEAGLAALGGVHEDVLCCLRAAGIAPADERFSPHLTLARIRPQLRVDLTPVVLAGAKIDLGPLPVREVVLYRSELGAAGPAYHRLAEAPLEGKMDA